MKKAPFLAALPLIAACDDGERIQDLLGSSDVQAMAAIVQNRCTRIINEGTVEDGGEGVNFTATAPGLTVCQCASSPDACIITETPSDPFLWETNASMSHEEDQAIIAVRKGSTPKIKVFIDPADEECTVTADKSDESQTTLNSRQKDVIAVCRDFIDRVRNTIAAIKKIGGSKLQK